MKFTVALLFWAALAGAAFLSPCVAQAPETVHLATTYKPGSRLLYAISVKATVDTSSGSASREATLNTRAEAELQVLPGATTNQFEIAARFTRYQTTVSAQDPAQLATLAKIEAAGDKASIGMPPARFRMAGGIFTVVSRAAGVQYDQGVDMLGELVRNDDLPPGDATVGAQWTHPRTRNIPQTNVSMPLTLHCRLTALGRENGAATAVIEITSAGSAKLPPGSLSDSRALARQGLVPFGKFSFHTVEDATYRVSDGVLLGTSSQTHSSVEIQLIGPSPQARTMDSNIQSTGTVRLESERQ
ncbi:MAG: hypothetical protein ACRD1Y_04340 [Terriglobales bacterium]